MWWSKRSTKTHVPVFKSMSVTQVRDVGGFDVGVMWQPQFKQISVLFEGMFDPVKDRTTLESWRAHLAMKPEVGVVSTIAQPQCAGTSMYALVTFLTPGMPKDEAETLVAKEASDCYAPYAVDMEWNPLSEVEIISYVSNLWAPTAENIEFPPVPIQIRESALSILCDDVVRIVFDVLEDDATNEEVNELVATGRLGEFENVYRIEINRLTADVARESGQTARLFRRAGILIVETPAEETSEGLANEIINELSPKTRLRINRMIGRQHLGVLLAAGVPAYGWQHSDHVSN